MKPIFRRPRWLTPAVMTTVLLALVIVTIAVTAEARPGGGSSYSGSRSSGSSRSSGGSSSSGGGGGGALFELLFWLCIQHPVIGIPLVLGIIAYLIIKARANASQNDWNSGGHGGDAPYIPAIAPYQPPTPTFDAIRAVDPGFSRIVFEDFLYSLYAEVHRARGMAALQRLSAYLSPQAAQTLQQMTRGPVDGVIVGALRALEINASPQTGSRAVIEFESNYTEAGRGAYAVEQWTLVRGPAAKSRRPDRVRLLGCPNCGAPQEALFSGTCKHCQNIVNDGTFDWTVQSVQVMTREERPPILTSSAEERGTNAPTIYDPKMPQMIEGLRAKDPSFDVGQFNTRVGLVFSQFQVAWSNRNLAQMRPFLSDALFTTQQYWVSAYTAQRLRNVTENAAIRNIEVVKLTSDAYFDAITVRLHAQSLDYTVSDDGKLVAGSKSKMRAYSEYWTFIRGTNRKGPARTDLACANCGAPLDVNMVGQCNYCKTKVTTGDFDWVLSRIEQDESYTG